MTRARRDRLTGRRLAALLPLALLAGTLCAALALGGCSTGEGNTDTDAAQAPVSVALSDGLAGAWAYVGAERPQALEGTVTRGGLVFGAEGACQVALVYRPPAGAGDTPPATRAGAVRDRARDVLGWQLAGSGRWIAADQRLQLTLGPVTISLTARIERQADGSLRLRLSEDPLFPALGATTWTRRPPTGSRGRSR